MATLPQIDINIVIKEQGFVGAVDVVLARIQAWPVDPNDPKYAIRTALARKLVPVAISWSAKSRALLIETRGHIEAWAASPVGNSIVAIQAVTAIVAWHNLMLREEQELGAYAAAGGGLSRLQVICARLLTNARGAYKAVEEYRGTWWYSITSLIQAIVDLIQKLVDLATDVVNGITSVVASVISGIGWLKWVALGLGGLYVYDKFIKKKATT